MRDEFKDKIITALGSRREAEAVFQLVKDEYEFRCASFVYAGPGHQSRHTCEDNRPHPVEGEHSDDLYEWEGTSVMSDGKLLFNAKHRGDGRCGH